MPITSNGQTLKEVKKALKKINSLEQIDELKKQYPNWTIYDDKTMLSDSSKFPDIIKAKVESNDRYSDSSSVDTTIEVYEL